MKRRVIVDHVKQMMEQKENGEKISTIRQYAMEAQAPYKTISMKDVLASGTFTGAPKYLKPRDQPLEIPIDCVRNLCDVMDTTFNEKVSL